MIERGDSLATITLAISEVLVGPVRMGREDLYKRYLSLFSQPEIRILDFDIKAVGHYAKIRQDKTIRATDAIQLACAASAGVDLFITNDDRLSRKNIPGITFPASTSLPAWRAPL